MKHSMSNTRLLAITSTLSIAAGLGVVALTNNLNQDVIEGNLAYVLMVALLFLGVVPPIWRYRYRQDLLDPLVIYPVIYSIVFAAPVLMDLYQKISGQISPTLLLRPEYLPELEIMALIGLAGLYGGLFWNKPRPVATRSLILGSSNRLKILRMIMGFSLFLQFWGILNYGLINWFFGIYGQGQFAYGAAYYLLLASQLLAYPAYLGYLCIRLSQRHYDVWVFLFPVVFGGLFFLHGGRGQVIYFLVSGLVVANYTRGRLGFQNIIQMAMVLIMVIFGSILFRQRTFDLSLLPNSFMETISILLDQFSSAGSLTTAVIEFGGEVIPFQYGLTYLGSIVNLVPGFIFESQFKRWILPPSLLFHNIYSPNVTEQGFGFSVLAEAYINWGIWGAFPAMLVIGSLLGYMHRRIATGSYSAIVMYAIFLFQSLWYLRGDSLAFIKSVFYSVMVLTLVEFIHRLGTSHVTVGKKDSIYLQKLRTKATQ